ncbi:hypothetical protein COZ14_03585 [Candidatus Dojkabacteria bacterium CG_4_10_14_3_um_filter_Dojkabacteria_WS6_41_9]|nr:MAG: hypothetical protein COZ14_03585 [Candidatus Dojkabacteria bacterium CG_4_10_14_3_um_filter_Dojkabacteria_WS6_41_9]
MEQTTSKSKNVEKKLISTPSGVNYWMITTIVLGLVLIVLVNPIIGQRMAASLPESLPTTETIISTPTVVVAAPSPSTLVTKVKNFFSPVATVKEAQLTWLIFSGNDDIQPEQIIISGYGYSATKVDYVEQLRSYLEEQGFVEDGRNSAMGTFQGADGYRYGNTVCSIFVKVSNTSDLDGPNDITLICGSLE